MVELTDRGYLMSQQYATSRNLAARIQLHVRFSTNRYGWQRWVFDRLQLHDTAQVLEIGCGRGDLWAENQARVAARWQVVLTDFSLGMLRDARTALSDSASRFSYTTADAQWLPFHEGFFDAVVANHMLYHVLDRPQAFAEIHRVLKQGGRLYAATNGRDHLRELHPVELAHHFGLERSKMGTVPMGVPGAIRAFDLESGGEQLTRVFANLRLHAYEDSLEVTEAEPLVAYLCSIVEISEEQAAYLIRRIAEVLAKDGPFHITKSSGLFEVVKHG